MGNWQPIFVFNTTYNLPDEIKFTEAKIAFPRISCMKKIKPFLASPAKCSFTEYKVNVKF